jgi:hypothetical protein
MSGTRLLAAFGVVAAGACGVVTGEPIQPPAPAQTCDAGACGPAPAQPMYACADGTLAGPTGRCILNQDGTCGWEIVACPSDGSTGPPTCSTTDCGPRPLVPDQSCDGGGTSGEVCESMDGGCGWVFVPCP